jgi:hypothetical protein
MLPIILPIVGWISGGYVANDFFSWMNQTPKEEETEEERNARGTRQMIVRIVMIVLFCATILGAIVLLKKRMKNGTTKS